MLLNENNFGAKGEGIKALAETVSSITINYKEAQSGISFMFNNFTEEQLETFNARISNLHITAKTEGKNFLG